MDFEDEDLTALRSAALASLSSKAQEEAEPQDDEEDLSALRLAALMTRKANQKIQVISQRLTELKQTPTEYRSPAATQVTLQSNTFNLPPMTLMSLPPPSGNPLQMRLPPPPLPGNIIRLRERFTTPPVNFHLRLFPPPASGQILKPAPPAPPNFLRMREPPPSFHLMTRPSPGHFIRMREPRPRHGNFHHIRNPSLRPPLLPTPGTRDSNTGSNLISLTPGPNTSVPAISMHSSSVVTVRPQSQFIRQRFQTRNIRPSMQKQHQKHVPKSKPEVVPEPKVPTKFDRYDNSSSDEDEEHTAIEKKNNSDDNEEEEQSDVESVASGKSFSSVSDVDKFDTAIDEGEDLAENENGEKVENENDESSVENDKNIVETEHLSDDNISIHDPNEEDDILAAIDDFLEDRPEKEKPKKPTKVNKPPSIEKKPPVKVEKKVIEKRKPVKPPSRKTSTSSKASDEIAEESKSGPPKTLQKILAKREAKQQNTKPQKAITKVSAPVVELPINEPKTQSSKFNKEAVWSVNPPPAKENITTVAMPAQPNTYTIPVFMTQNQFSPPRQRRDSDLDSVGTSDLSFISSESEIEVEEKKTETKQTQRRPRTRSMSGSNNQERSRSRDAERPSQSKKSQREDRSSPTVKTSKISARPDSASSKNNQNLDLRKKLETRGIVKQNVVVDNEPHQKKNTSTKDSSQTSRRAFSPVRKTGVISLKKKSSRIPPPTQPKKKSKSRSRESSPDNIKLPDLNEARRIIITRPNTDVSSSSKRTSSEKQIKTTKKRKHEQSGQIETDRNLTMKRKLSSADELKQNKHKIRDEDKDDSPIPRNRRRSVLPPKSENETDAIRRNKRKNSANESRKIHSKKQTTPSSDETSSSDDDENSSSDAADSDVQEEEVFAVDDVVLPDFDDVLGNFDDDESNDGEYISSNRKSRKLSQTKSKKTKRAEKSSDVNRLPDSRRIVPKSSPKPESEDEKVKPQKPRKSVHERLGRITKVPETKKRIIHNERLQKPVRKTSPKWESESSSSSESSGESSESETGEDSYDFDSDAPRSKKPILPSSYIRVAPKMKKVYPGEEIYDRSSRKDINEEKKERDMKHRKRKILVSGRKDTTSAKYVIQERKADHQAKRYSVKDRIGKHTSDGNIDKQQMQIESRRVLSKKSKQDPKDSITKSEKRRKRDTNVERDDRPPKPGKKEDFLEAKIKKIKEKNSRIMRRQKEIEMEKQKFGF
uniref:nucleolar protein NET1-like n=1 Tax=Styela clava TaxID=7725 RepID=UPI0019399E7A|nr:nucleolar protein NET1-like [Styela clava]